MCQNFQLIFIPLMGQSIDIMKHIHMNLVLFIVSFNGLFLLVCLLTLLFSFPPPIYHSVLIFLALQSPRSGSPGFTGGQYSEAGPSAENKMALTDFGSFRPAVRDRQLPHDWLYWLYHYFSLSSSPTFQLSTKDFTKKKLDMRKM